MKRQSGWWWYGIDMEQATAYKYSNGDINSSRQFSKVAVLMCVRDGEHDNGQEGADHEDVPGTGLEENGTNHDDKSVGEVKTIAKEGNGGKERQLQSPQQRRKFAKGGGTCQEELGISKETENAGNM